MKIRTMGILLSSVAMAVALTGCNDNEGDTAKGDGKSQSTPAENSKPSKGKDEGGKGEGIAEGEKDPASGGGTNGGNGSGGSGGSGEESTEPCSNPDLKVTMTVQAGEGSAGASTVQAKNTGSTTCRLPKVVDLSLWENKNELPVELEVDPAGEGLKLAPSRSASATLAYTLPGDKEGRMVHGAVFAFDEVGDVDAELMDGIGMDGMYIKGSDFILSDFQRD
ncbi:DUF4232 domain-containing protein [Streptomyces sp. NPDC048639]|uniref:DUF4232 domain-containing protein n=1 Tax=Streptomyces sp. NPDC048639 TaxID=3365581 RepID=UPI00371D0DDB